ncbi:hypothetical protein [uncultured Pseudacidovorax sp.]|uniref:hypothetical protein n=1 Tax=uncultured Pseudacidovorax sp. TaxID=679313 RepID=UPI0025EC118C|nr:hypothetical protein [uncultured Pseudacidovorax sp.]
MYQYSPSTGGFYLEAIHGDAIPPDSVDVTQERHAELIDAQATGQRIVPGPDGAPALEDPPAPTEEQRMRALSDAVQRWLDTAAQADGYDDIRSAVTYAEEPAVPVFQEQGRRYRAWRSLVWAACYSILDQWRGGTRPEPTPEQLIAELPSLESIESA